MATQGATSAAASRTYQSQGSQLQAYRDLPASEKASTLVAAALVLMAIIVHTGNRSEGGRNRLRLRALRYIVPILFVVSIIIYLIVTARVFGKIHELFTADTTSFKSASGIAKFCRELQVLTQEQYVQVVFIISAIYMFLQTLCIPGTIVLNAAVGAIMGTLIGLPLCTSLGTLGAISCYTLSNTVGTTLVEAADARLMKGKGLPNIRKQVRKYRSDLFVFLLFLRLTPILPNWLVNLASPVVGVPLRIFAAGTFIGIIPQTYLMVRFGALAKTQQTGESIVSVWDTLLLAVLGVALLVGFRLRKRFSSVTADADGAEEDKEDGDEDRFTRPPESHYV